MIAQGPLASWAHPFVAESDQLVAAVLEFGVLRPQRVAPCLGFLPVAHPFRTPQLQRALHFLKNAPFFFELEHHLLFDGRRRLHPQPRLAQLDELAREHMLFLEHRLAAAIVPRQFAQLRELISDVVKRHKLHGEWRQRVAGNSHILQFDGHPLSVSLVSGQLDVRDP